MSHGVSRPLTTVSTRSPSTFEGGVVLLEHAMPAASATGGIALTKRPRAVCIGRIVHEGERDRALCCLCSDAAERRGVVKIAQESGRALCAASHSRHG